jgi:hypothetical protein
VLPEQTPPEQAPHELTTDEAMFRAFGPPSDEDDEESEGDEADEEEEDGGQHQDEGQQDRGQHQDGPIYRFLFLVKFLFSD